MPGSLLFTDKDDINNLDTSSNPILQSTEHIEQEDEEEEEKQVNIWSEITLTEHDSFLMILKRLCIYWRRILLNKIRLIFTLVFMSMLNITARIICFVRHRTPPPAPSASSFTAAVTASSIRTLEEDLNDSSKSLLIIDKKHKQEIDLSSLHNSKMAHILVHQQTHRSSNISIHQSNSTQKDSKLPMTHSVDDRLFLHDSTRLLNLLTRFASEPQMSKYHTQSTTSNGHFSKTNGVFALSSPVSNPCLQVNEPEKDEIHFDDIFYLNCDKIQPVFTSLTDDLNSDKTDNIITIINPSSEPIIILDDDIKNQELDEDILFDISPSINFNDPHCERHFRRRKRRSSLTKSSTSVDDTQLTIDLLEKLDVNQQQSQEIDENFQLKQNDDDNNKQNTNIIETKTSKNEECNETIVDDEKPTTTSRYRGRRLRHRFYRHTASASSPPEVPTNISPQFYLPNEELNIEAPRLHSSPPLSPEILSPRSSPGSPTLTLISNQTSPNTAINGGIKRINSAGITKKNVRFADSVGRELAQVQYIRSSINDESKELSFLLGSSLLSSSPPSYIKTNLYVPNTSRLEHKPWSFDVALTPNKQTNGTPLPRRFFCLYRQPNSEHPDIYLHEIWKSQIKLEHADIPVKYFSTGEQQLNGTLWVTNASYSKYISVKYTFNHWLNTYEHEAQYRCHSNDFRNIDQFEFTITLPADVDQIDFVLRYCVNGQEYWDNNEGKNYTLQTESAYTPSTPISLPHDCDFNEMRFY